MVEKNFRTRDVRPAPVAVRKGKTSPFYSAHGRPDAAFCSKSAAPSHSHNMGLLKKCALNADPVFSGLAISLTFGIPVSTVLTLVVIPLLYFMA